MRASELADPIVPWVNCPFVMCMGASPECSALILQSVRKGYNVLALGWDAPWCLRELYVDPNYDASLLTSVEITPEQLTAALSECELGAADPSVPAVSAAAAVHWGQSLGQKPGQQARIQALLARLLPNDLKVTGHLLLSCKVDIRTLDLYVRTCQAFAVKTLLPAPVGYLIKHLGMVNDHCHLPGISEQCALNFTDKKRVRDLLVAADCHTAPQLCLSEAELILPWAEIEAKIASFVATQGFPLICKPRFGSGSRLVTVVTNAAEVKAALLHVAERITSKASRGDIFCYDMLIEDYIEHDLEVSGNGIIVEGKLIAPFILTKLEMSPWPYRQELSYSSRLLPPAQRAAIIAELERVAAALGINNSVIMSDIVLCGDRSSLTPYVVDVAGRHTGYFLYRTFALSHGDLMPYFFDYVVNHESHPTAPDYWEQVKERTTSLQVTAQGEHIFVQHFYNIKPGTVRGVPNREHLLGLIARALPQDDPCAHLGYFSCHVQLGAHYTRTELNDGAVTHLGFTVLKDIPEPTAQAIMVDFINAFVIEPDA